MHAKSSSTTVVGIDVGGTRKGFHTVALKDGKYLDHASFKEQEKDRTHLFERIVSWCQGHGAQMIAVDAPCRWSTDGRCRPAERELAQKGITCFATPKRETAVNHATGNFEWMRQGEALYQALGPTFPLATATPKRGQQCSFETYPHAITWHLRGGDADARQKRTQRRALLEKAGINLTHLTNIDLVDAALCALTAHHAALEWECLPLGTVESGLIIVPTRLK
ncbi:DUF429 domain-containing protein [Verrucomicrobium sp. BvORR106]|uniref:DUF429 domain-containing protein n=1 Tax=Verrucomicrobium sp. BvORR106 TaxID=1403819 RepID=UPI00056DC137|nr:DUF429 domain-containing protein [Verrucomicrobium sp. BvORR106]